MTSHSLSDPLALPCGIILKNRLIKSAMSDSLGDGAGNATPAQMRLYERWAMGGAALSLIGEVQITPHFAEKPGNLVLAADADSAGLRMLAKRGAAQGAHIWPQLGHAGALAHAPISAPKGPSPLNLEGLHCSGMTVAEIDQLPHDYARAALLAQDAGFGGVQVHASHGFLLSQFLSPLFNRRTDAFGGTIAQRFRVIGRIISAIRQAVGPAFPIAIKINATDKLAGGLTTEDALEVVRLLDQTSVDLIEISGGTYFPGAPSSSDGAATSGPYFIDFSRRAKAITAVPIVLTGGFITFDQASEVVQSGAADAVGLARALVLDPALPTKWLSGAAGDPRFPAFDAPARGAVTAWYSMRLTALAEDSEDRFEQSANAALTAYDARDAARCVSWRARFGVN